AAVRNDLPWGPGGCVVEGGQTPARERRRLQAVHGELSRVPFPRRLPEAGTLVRRVVGDSMDVGRHLDLLRGNHAAAPSPRARCGRMNPTDDGTPRDVPERSLLPIAPPVAQQRFPSWKQALLILGGGVVLAATACFGFLVSLGGNFERGG